MAPKKRRKKAPAPEDDWKSTLFCWRGRVVEEPVEEEALDGGAARATWTGTWVGCGHGEARPTDADHAASENTFALGFEIDHTPWDPAAREYEFAGAYLLDQGDGSGLGEYRDHTHVVRFGPAGDDGARPCAAVGTTEFAPFVSFGELRADGTLLLARRYLEEDDARCGWDADEALNSDVGDPLAWERLTDVGTGLVTFC